MTGGKILINRSVLEQALEALETGIQYDYHGNPYSDNDAARCGAYDALRAALDQPQPLPSPVWRLVPTTMTNAMAAVDKELRHTVPWIRWEAILAAAPQSPIQPPALEQPQVEQEPIGKAHEWNNSEGFTYCIWDARVVPIGTKLYTHPQPPRQPLTPLTDDQIKAANELGRGEK